MAAAPPYVITPVVQAPQPPQPPWGRLLGMPPPDPPSPWPGTLPLYQLTASSAPLGTLTARITAP